MTQAKRAAYIARAQVLAEGFRQRLRFRRELLEHGHNWIGEGLPERSREPSTSIPIIDGQHRYRALLRSIVAAFGVVVLLTVTPVCLASQLDAQAQQVGHGVGTVNAATDKRFVAVAVAVVGVAAITAGMIYSYEQSRDKPTVSNGVHVANRAVHHNISGWRDIVDHARKAHDIGKDFVKRSGDTLKGTLQHFKTKFGLRRLKARFGDALKQCAVAAGVTWLTTGNPKGAAYSCAGGALLVYLR